MKTLEKGEPAPNFTLQGKNGEKSLHNIKGKKIIFFYPMANTTTCTKQVCSVQESYTDLKTEGISEVIGISTDSAKKQEKFKQDNGVDYLFVSDKSGGIARDYGVFVKKYLFLKLSKRVTFLIDENNMIENVLKNGKKGQYSKYGTMEKHGTELLDLIKLEN